MKSNRNHAAAWLFLAIGLALPLASQAHTPHVCPANNPETPNYVHPQSPTPTGTPHFSQQDILNGVYSKSSGDSFTNMFTGGGAIADIRWNECDGQGRPATTGMGLADAVAQGVTTKRNPAGQQNNLRTSGPEATSCGGCHSQPRTGGSGDFVANTFDGAEGMDPVTYSVDPSQTNQRNTKGMFGSGYLEIAGIEMSADLKAQAAAIAPSATPTWYTFTTKGVNFDIQLTNGKVTDAHGVDTDLIVKPFGWGGTVASMRQFTVQASNRHHGMQAEESYDDYLGDPDYDEDGVPTELTIGDITMVSLWQAMLPMPVQVIPDHADKALKESIAEGAKLFDTVGCGSCHTPKMTLNSNLFCEPNVNNPPEIFHDQSQKFCVPLNTSSRSQAHADPSHAGDPVTIHAYTDLKRHDLCDPTTAVNPIRTLCNEHLNDDRPDVDGTPGYEFFGTPHLWDVHSSAPYGHNGAFPSVFSIINVHAGEALTSRNAYLALPIAEQQSIIEFLKTLRIKDQRLRVNGEG